MVYTESIIIYFNHKEDTTKQQANKKSCASTIWPYSDIWTFPGKSLELNNEKLRQKSYFAIAVKHRIITYCCYS